ncbi:acyl-ACP--UDP-N-acetylglucosamine O-acyltransferase [Aquirufa ecclesiirivi]|uniref:acyl-ACP--UDP-N-acetylglucosamine O-acyltransferase n=1 Tax=Aquirufa ecclesiirivi TaxID=2715124 RepID=UPI00140B422A|nr:acyl-ACP--UDP-N-acetylglucosamine O-acyltransferase [Aquirufa ecclesiirivi]MCZ2472234.1 acyl-ACP--UDP-N-acetylglucosamine O-acyltransferase [Aquirufa ecclesiirivi]MDF0693941.1 acyl-ACP--UDP-N-acetylglucosamine O-acyltransferase [Aquirufa ecclesiirivi]NHC48619.1 acyl-ACP--UDP-N-acetylglucosamine O-acyltransferase [Aquirufa ecclesiirivi]
MTYPLTHIDPSAKIGQNVTIDPFTMIHGDVEIGDGTWIGSNVTIFPGARIGKNVRIFPGAVIAAIPQDLKFGGEKTTAEIGDNTTIRECVTINRGTVDKDRTVVGKNCLIMAYVHIAHDCQIADHCILANAVQMAGHVTVGEYAIIGGSTAIHQFASIGKHVMISGGSLVRKDVPPYTKSGREPLTYAGINSVGLRRRNFSDVQIADIQEIYRYVYQKGLNIQTALSEIEEQISPSLERDEILSFIRSSERGIMKG